MFVDSNKRWLLTATDNQFIDRCTIYWQLTVWFWNDDSHCEIHGQRRVDICYYRVGGRIPRTRCLAPSVAFRCWTCFFDSGSNRYLRQTVESICAFCLVHGQRVKPFETSIDAQSLLTFAAFVTECMMEGCSGHLVQQQSGNSTCWFSPPTKQAAHRGRASKNLMQRSLTHGSAGHADERCGYRRIT